MKNGLSLLLIFSALFFWSLTFEEFETPKSYALIAFACFAAFHVNWRVVLKDKIARYLSLFVVSAAVSAALSVDPRMSFWGNPKFPSGILIYISYLVVYLAASQLPAWTSKGIKKTTLWCAAIIAAYAILQVFGVDFMAWHGTVKEGQFVRPPSTMGHPNFMAAYLAMALPFAFERKGRWSYLLMGLIAAAIILSQSRGMWIATTAGMLTHGLLSGMSYKRFVKGFGAILALVAIVVLLVPSFRYGAAYRVKDMFSPGAARLEYPAAAIRIWGNNPFFGVGTDAFEIAFQHERTPHYWQVESKGSPTRAHSEFLNIMATQGLFGGIVIILLTLEIFRAFKRCPSRIAEVSAIVAFYVGNISGFPVISTGILFMVCLSLLKEKPNEITTGKYRSYPRVRLDSGVV